MNKLLKDKWRLLIVSLCMLSCQQSQNSEKTYRPPANAVVTAKGDSAYNIIQLPVTNLSGSDIQYLDLMIPQDAMVEIYYNAGKTEPEYIDELKKHLKSKYITITVFETSNFPRDVKPVGRLYIHDTGDHRYVLYIF